MYKNIKNNKGFTIIEVLIVLAIAALILLIVFLAVPALQRSARNNSRKNDAAAVAAAVNEFKTNNNGNLPSELCMANPIPSTTVDFTDGGTGTTPSQAKVGYFTGHGATAEGAENAASGGCTTATTGSNGNNGISIVVAAGTPVAYTGGANGTGGDSLEVQTSTTCDGGTPSGFGGASPKFTPANGSGRQFSVLYSDESGSGSYSVACIDS